MQNSLAQKISSALGALCFLALCLIPLTAQAREAKEIARIEHLISSIEKLSGAKSSP